MNCVSDSTTGIPTRATYRGVDILLRPRSITTYQVQSILTGYKLEPNFIGRLEALYQNEPFVVPSEIIYTGNIGMAVSPSGIDAIKEFKFTHVKEVCILFPR
jgi:hypothetical protein